MAIATLTLVIDTIVKLMLVVAVVYFLLTVIRLARKLDAITEDLDNMNRDFASREELAQESILVQPANQVTMSPTKVATYYLDLLVPATLTLTNLYKDK
jgi:hypothetical protein